MVKPNGQVDGSMPEGDEEWRGALNKPSSTLSAGAIIIGIWMVFLTIINILIGAYSEGRKVNWIAFITNGAETNSAHQIALTFPDDLMFGILSIFVLSIGIIGMNSAREDGFMGWISNLHKEKIVSSLFSIEEGMERVLASWMVLSGFLYYVVWSAFETTWVDPGVYSITIASISIGVGIHWIQDSKSEN